MKNTRLKTLTVALFGVAFVALLPQIQAAPEIVPAPDGCYPGFTTAEGCDALKFVTTGVANTGIGWRSLFSAGGSSFNTGVGAGTLVLNSSDSNTAVGAAALILNSTASENTAVGAGAMVFNNADANTAVGYQALNSNVNSVTNTAVGTFAGQNNDSSGNGTADFNTAVGGFAFRDNVNGARNTAVGAGALEVILGGDDNTAIGELAGVNYTGTESNNICIGSGTQGTAGESNAIRIGNASTSNGITLANTSPLANAIAIGTGMSTQGISILTLLGFGGVSIANGLQTVAGASTCFIGGIYNQAFGPSDQAVRVGNDNKLGTVVSSRRFKHDIKPMDNSSEAVLALKPVTFLYNADTTNTPRVGLVAEEVAEVSRALVIADKEGKPLSVRYEDVNVMLLNEFIKEHKKVEQLQATVAQQQKGMDVLTAQLKEQAAQIQKVSAQVEMNKPAPQVVANKP
jgi:trimeric autotransporter adhesin